MVDFCRRRLLQCAVRKPALPSLLMSLREMQCSLCLPTAGWVSCEVCGELAHRGDADEACDAHEDQRVTKMSSWSDYCFVGCMLRLSAVERQIAVGSSVAGLNRELPVILSTGAFCPGKTSEESSLHSNVFCSSLVSARFAPCDHLFVTNQPLSCFRSLEDDR